MFIKNKKGFSLLEVLVTMGIVTVLAGIAIPAYNKYKDGVKDTAVKSDIANGRKAYLAYDAVNNTFCASLEAAGLGGFGESDIYTKADDYFIGLVRGTGTGACATGSPAATAIVKEKTGGGASVGGAGCTLLSSEFTMGAGFKKGSHSVGYNISNDSSGPVATTSGTCAAKDPADDASPACAGRPYSGTNPCSGSNKCKWNANTTDICA